MTPWFCPHIFLSEIDIFFNEENTEGKYLPQLHLTLNFCHMYVQPKLINIIDFHSLAKCYICIF